MARPLLFCEKLHSRMWNLPINCFPANPAYLLIEEAKTTCPFEYCSMDLITDLPMINKYNSILVVVDQGLSKGVILSPHAKPSLGKK